MHAPPVRLFACPEPANHNPIFSEFQMMPTKGTVLGRLLRLRVITTRGSLLLALVMALCGSAPIYAQTQPSQVPDVDGWNGAMWGMTADQVKAIFPDLVSANTNGENRYVHGHLFTVRSGTVAGFVYFV